MNTAPFTYLFVAAICTIMKLNATQDDMAETSTSATNISLAYEDYTLNHSVSSRFSITTCGGTANGSRCVFPFVVRGIVYNECTQVNEFQYWRHWCATEPGEFARHKKWGFCNCSGIAIGHPGQLDATCEAYNGSLACKPFRSNRTVFVDNKFSQQVLGKHGMDSLKQALLDSDEKDKDRCLTPMIKTLCQIVFPDCIDTHAQYSVYPKPLCKENCDQFQHGNCSDYFVRNTATVIAHFSKYYPVHVYIQIPQCDVLPSTKDMPSSCTDIRIDLGYHISKTAISTDAINQSSKSVIQTIGIVVGIVVPLLVVAAVMIQVIRKRQKQSNNSASNASYTVNSNSLMLSAPNSLSSSMTVKDAVESCCKEQNLESMHWQSGTTATTNLREYPLEKIKYVKELGEGQFGKVFMGIIEDFNTSDGHPLPVAVKLLKPSSSDRMKHDFYKELYVISNLCHSNIINLLATYVNDNIYCMVFEYMCHGDLSQFLQSSQIGEVEQIMEVNATVKSEEQPKPKHTVTVDNLIYIIMQVSCGLSYLAEEKFVHRDIATRNCLVGNSITIKIADFGLSRDVYTSDYYRVAGQALLPIRWMSPESILYGKFTPKTDIWAFGVLMWEVFTLGKKPYYGQSNQEVIQYVMGGGRLPPPDDYCPSSIRKVMELCWQQNAEERPKAQDLPNMLQI